jgi:hypothetical protein
MEEGPFRAAMVRGIAWSFFPDAFPQPARSKKQTHTMAGNRIIQSFNKNSTFLGRSKKCLIFVSLIKQLSVLRTGYSSSRTARKSTHKPI